MPENDSWVLADPATIKMARHVAGALYETGLTVLEMDDIIQGFCSEHHIKVGKPYEHRNPNRPTTFAQCLFLGKRMVEANLTNGQALSYLGNLIDKASELHPND